MAFTFSQPEFDQLEAFAFEGDYAGFYQRILDLTDGADVEPSVREWFRVAQLANSDDGSDPCELIRTYTAAQAFFRTGQTPTSTTRQTP